MLLQICVDESCTCIHYRLLDSLKRGRNDDAKLLLENIENFCEITDSSGCTLLHYAVKYGNATMMQYLINKGCNVNAPNHLGATPLTMAVHREDPIATGLLLNSNADIYGMINTLPLIVYCCLSQNGDLKLSYDYILKWFFEKVNKNFFHENHEMAQQLLNADDIVKFSAVVFGDIELAKVVLKNGHPIDFQDPIKGFTALHWAVMFEKIEHAKILIELGANVDIKDHSEYVPLQYYSNLVEQKDEQSELLDTLLRHSVISNIDVLKTVINLITSFNKRTVRTVLKSRIAVNWYIYENESLPYYSCSIFHMLLQNQNADVLDLLEELDIKFDVNERAFNGVTPLIIAIHFGSLEKVTFLLKYGVKVNLKVDDETPLSYTAFRVCWFSKARKIYAKITKLLLQHGADIQDTIDFVLKSRFHWLALFRNTIFLAHLALNKAVDQSSSNENLYRKIHLDKTLKTDFDKYTQQLDEMKNIQVHGLASLFQLFSEKEEKIAALAHNQEFILAFNNIMKSKVHFDSYYLSTLKNRVGNIMNKNELVKRATLVCESLTGLISDIVCKIISYLNLQDLLSLSRV